MENYKEKIKKLLALSESSNEHEAKAALLKAKQLMIEHKIKESDLDEGKLEVVCLTSNLTYSVRRDVWIGHLANVIADNYLCRAVVSRKYGCQTRTSEFYGLPDDAEICLKVFEYAVDCIKSECDRIKKENRGYSANFRKSLCNGYALGFIDGLQELFEEQSEVNKEKWGLVPVMSDEVAHSIDGFEVKSEKVSASSIYNAAGYAAGKNFNMGNKVTAR